MGTLTTTKGYIPITATVDVATMLSSVTTTYHYNHLTMHKTILKYGQLK